MGAITLNTPAAAQPHRTYFGDRMVRYYALTPSNSYATGGETVAFPLFKVNVDFLLVEDLNVDATHVYHAIYDRTNGKLKVINLIGGAEVANAVDLSALSFRAMVVGK